MRVMSAGCGGTSAVSEATKSSRVIDNMGLKRFSNPRVDAGLVPGVDFQLGRQAQQTPLQRVVQLRRHLTLSSGQVRSTDRADEERVARENEPGFVAPAQVSHQQADAVGRMAWRVDHVDDHVARFQALAVVQRREIERHATFVALVQVVGRPDTAGQLQASGVVVGMHMGVDDMHDRGASTLRFFDEPVFVARNDVHRDGLLKASASK
jgi:hypothetical protein